MSEMGTSQRSVSERQMQLKKELMIIGWAGSLLAVYVFGTTVGKAKEKMSQDIRVANAQAQGIQDGMDRCVSNMNDERNIGTFMLTYSNVEALAQIPGGETIAQANPGLAQALSGSGVKHVRLVPHYRGDPDQVNVQMEDVGIVLGELETSGSMVFTTLLDGLAGSQIQGMGEQDAIMVEVDQVICDGATNTGPMSNT